MYLVYLLFVIVSNIRGRYDCGHGMDDACVMRDSVGLFEIGLRNLFNKRAAISVTRVSNNNFKVVRFCMPWIGSVNSAFLVWDTEVVVSATSIEG